MQARNDPCSLERNELVVRYAQATEAAGSACKWGGADTPTTPSCKEKAAAVTQALQAVDKFDDTMCECRACMGTTVRSLGKCECGGASMR